MEKITSSYPIIKYNLACGNDYRDGYINVDDNSMFNGKVDEIADIFDYRIPRHSANEILLCHFMMYMIPENAIRLFERWYFGLKKGGKLVIETQDLKKLTKIISESKEPQVINDAVVQFYGVGNTSGHVWTWCVETIKPLLEYVGFKEFEVFEGGYHDRIDRDFTIVATK